MSITLLADERKMSTELELFVYVFVCVVVCICIYNIYQHRKTCVRVVECTAKSVRANSRMNSIGKENIHTRTHARTHVAHTRIHKLRTHSEQSTHGGHGEGHGGGFWGVFFVNGKSDWRAVVEQLINKNS